MSESTLAVSVNGEHRTVPAGTTVAELVADVTPAPRGVAVAVNDAVVPRSQWQSTPLGDADRVEVLTAVPGG